MSWINAYGRGLLIFLYFVIATVWLPNYVVKLDSVASASSFVGDAIVLIVWGAALVAGLYMLRRLQRRGLI